MARLLDLPVNGRYPFRYTSSGHTNVRETFERLRPGWNLNLRAPVIKLQRKEGKL